MQEVKFSVTNSGEAVDFPLLVSFPQGIPQNHEDMALMVGRKQSGKAIKTMITSSFDDVVYKASDYGEYTTKKDSCKFAIGVLDEKTKKLRIIKTDHVFVMKPQIEAPQTTAPRNSTMDYAERRQSLTDEFGSRKKKRALMAEKSNTILTENIAGAKTIQNILAVQSPHPKAGTTPQTDKSKAAREGSHSKKQRK
jgi:hypothetical protein